jgi:hypothetical protein
MVANIFANALSPGSGWTASLWQLGEPAKLFKVIIC